MTMHQEPSTLPVVGPVLLRPEQAAEALSIGRTAVFALIRSGRLRSVKVGGLRRISASALADFVRQLEEEQAA
jgi:excisionase family DNA binding protein